MSAIKEVNTTLFRLDRQEISILHQEIGKILLQHDRFSEAGLRHLQIAKVLLGGKPVVFQPRHNLAQLAQSILRLGPTALLGVHNTFLEFYRDEGEEILSAQTLDQVIAQARELIKYFEKRSPSIGEVA